MFIRQLAYLIALDKHRHFGRAAESCHVSQPALSNGIRELERELGITIIKRNRTFEGITPEGERVIQWVRQVLASLEGLRQEADLVRSVPRGHLAIGVIPTANHAATLLSAEYREILPQLTLEVTSLSTPEILRRLKAQDIQLGILYDRSVANDGNYDVMPLFSERYVLIASEQASLPHQLDWAEVAQLPLCLLSPDMQNRPDPGRPFRRPGGHPARGAADQRLARATGRMPERPGFQHHALERPADPVRRRRSPGAPDHPRARRERVPRPATPRRAARPIPGRLADRKPIGSGGHPQPGAGPESLITVDYQEFREND
ncbi:LysR substrate-binding domain-containing protein [Achromobacter aloeverae]